MARYSDFIRSTGNTHHVCQPYTVQVLDKESSLLPSAATARANIFSPHGKQLPADKVAAQRWSVLGRGESRSAWFMRHIKQT